MASGSGWNLWVWLLGVVLRRYIDFLILLIPTPLVSVLFCSSIPTFLYIKKKMFFVLYIYTVTCRSRACSGSCGTTAACRFQPNRIFCSRTHRRTAGSAPAPARLRAQGAPSHRSRSARPPRSETPLARSTSYASLDRSFARIVCAYIDIRSSVRTHAHI